MTLLKQDVSPGLVLVATRGVGCGGQHYEEIKPDQVCYIHMNLNQGECSIFPKYSCMETLMEKGMLSRAVLCC